jgi:hypothetical protein
MSTAGKLAVSAACMLLSPLLSADTIDATDPAGLVSIIRDLGYRAALESDEVGDPMIRSSVGGTEFAILFFGCAKGKQCRSLLFKVGYDLDDGTTLDVINDWNATKLFGRAYLDEEADPWLELSVNTYGGVNRLNFEDTYDWWESSSRSSKTTSVTDGVPCCGTPCRARAETTAAGGPDLKGARLAR